MLCAKYHNRQTQFVSIHFVTSRKNKLEDTHYMQLFSVCTAAVRQILSHTHTDNLQVFQVPFRLGSCLPDMFIDHNHTWNDDWELFI